MKKPLLIFVFSVLLAFHRAAFAQINDQSDPQTLIKTATEQVLNEVRTRAVDPEDIPRIMSIVNRDILPYIDFRRTTRLSLGRHWKTATPQQQEQLIGQFELLLVHLYSGTIAQLSPDQRIEYPPLHVSPTDTDIVVRTLPVTNGRPIEIDYRLYKTPQGWRVYDLNVLGAWLIQTYRQQFNETIQERGIAGLIQSLTERNQQLAAGNAAGQAGKQPAQ